MLVLQVESDEIRKKDGDGTLNTSNKLSRARSALLAE